MLVSNPTNTADLSRLRRTLQQRQTSFETHNLHEAQTHLDAKLRGIGLTIPDSSSFRGIREGLIPGCGPIHLGVGCITATEFDLIHETGNEVLVCVPLFSRGSIKSGPVCFDVAPGDVLVCAPRNQFAWHWHGPEWVLNLKIPLPAFKATLQHHALKQAPFGSAPLIMLDRARSTMLLGFLELLISSGTGDEASRISDAVVESAQHLLLSLLIDGWMTAPAVVRGATPYYVRRAETYMRAHLDAGLSINTVAQAVGVSRRTLAYGFRKVNDITPQLFLRQIRLEQARRLLADPRRATRTVTEIAAAVAYLNPSQFSRDYRLMFGETPSQTINHARQQLLRIVHNPAHHVQERKRN